MTILFENWKIHPKNDTSPRQYDNLSDTLLVSGELPAGYSWDMLVSIGSNLDILTLSAMTGGIGVVLTASMLSQTGYYRMQLRGTKGTEVRHSDLISVFIDRSLSGAAQWPTLPTEFSQAEARIHAAAGHYPYIGANGNWFVWDVTDEAWEDTGSPARGAAGPQGPTGTTGAAGTDGYSPVITVSAIQGGHSVSITDAEHQETPLSFDVMDGAAQDLTPYRTASAQDLIDAGKADNDGYYGEMTVGAAENLTGRGDGVSAHFTHRPSGGHAGDIQDGLATIKRVKGNTLVWNQMVQNGNFASTEGWTSNRAAVSASGNIGTLTINDNSSTTDLSIPSGYRFAVLSGHKYFISGMVKTSKSYNLGRIGLGGGSSINAIKTGISFIPGVWVDISAVGTADTDVSQGNACFMIRVGSGGTFEIGDTVEFRNIMVVDLTSMFGEGNEPATAPAFRSLFPLPYYGYNVGSLLHYTGTGIKTVGFNCYDPATGTAVLLGGKQYQLSGTYTAISYSTGETITPDADGLFTPTADGTLVVTGGNDIDTCVHLTWSGYRNDEYEPYWTNTKALPISTYFPTGMKSAGSVYDELTADKAIQRCQIVDGAVVALDLPVVTTIDPPLNLTYPISDFGTEESLPANGAEPTASPFVGTIVYGVNAVDTIRNLPKDYQSQDSMDSLLAALGTAMGGTWTKTWDATNNRWTFLFSENGGNG